MGAGDMIARIKANNALVKKRSYYDIREEYLKAANGKPTFYKEATADEIKAIRRKVIRNRKNSLMKRIIAFCIAIVFTLIFLMVVAKGILMLFER
jgi:hypothetical protein